MQVKITIPKKYGEKTRVKVEHADGVECAEKLTELLRAHGIREAKATDDGNTQHVGIEQSQ